MVLGIFSWDTFGTLLPIKRDVISAFYLDIVTDYMTQFMTTVHSATGSHFCRQYKLKVVAYIIWPQQSTDLYSLNYIWDVVERKILIMDPQPTNFKN